MADDPRLEVHTAPPIFSGPAYDRLIAKAKAQRAEVEQMLTPEALARIDAAETRSLADLASRGTMPGK